MLYNMISTNPRLDLRVFLIIIIATLALSAPYVWLADTAHLQAGVFSQAEYGLEVIGFFALAFTIFPAIWFLGYGVYSPVIFIWLFVLVIGTISGRRPGKVVILFPAIAILWEAYGINHGLLDINEKTILYPQLGYWIWFVLVLYVVGVLYTYLHTREEKRSHIIALLMKVYIVVIVLLLGMGFKDIYFIREPELRQVVLEQLNYKYATYNAYIKEIENNHVDILRKINDPRQQKFLSQFRETGSVGDQGSDAMNEIERMVVSGYDINQPYNIEGQSHTLLGVLLMGETEENAGNRPKLDFVYSRQDIGTYRATGSYETFDFLVDINSEAKEYDYKTTVSNLTDFPTVRSPESYTYKFDAFSIRPVGDYVMRAVPLLDKHGYQFSDDDIKKLCSFNNPSYNVFCIRRGQI